ncbi:MAG: hypothetical protein LC808_24710, partial [Actinobacteria bacterium]|nr:hypothetical protein [Actinomycetota bacterium]
YQAFKAKASQTSQAIGHDIAIGFNRAVSAIVKTVDDWFNGDAKKPECTDALRDWQIAANATEVRGCAVSVGSGQPAIRVANDLRMPYDIPLPRGTNIGITDYDLDAGPTAMLMRAINRPTGTMVVGARGRAQFSMPAGVPKLGTHLDVPMYPDQLGLALDVIFAMLTWLPESKVFREQFSATAVHEVWELGARNLTITQFFVEFKGIIGRTVSQPAALEIASKWADASSCAAAAFEHGLNSGNADPQVRTESTIKVAKDCLATTLEAAGSGFQEFWKIIQSIPEGVRGLGQVYDGARIGLLHFGGQLNLSIGHEQPDPLRETPWLEVVASDVDCSTPGLGVELRWPPKKHDITSDGILDSFVPVECFTGDASSDTQLEVFDGASNPAWPTRIGVLTTMSNVWDDPTVTIYPFNIKHIRVNEVSFNNRMVTIKGDGYIADDCLHCPSYAITQQISWTGNGFSFGAMQAEHA